MRCRPLCRSSQLRTLIPSFDADGTQAPVHRKYAARVFNDHRRTAPVDFRDHRDFARSRGMDGIAALSADFHAEVLCQCAATLDVPAYRNC